jgi:hypothetical protein
LVLLKLSQLYCAGEHVSMDSLEPPLPFTPPECTSLDMQYRWRCGCYLVSECQANAGTVSFPG